MNEQVNGWMSGWMNGQSKWRYKCGMDKKVSKINDSAWNSKKKRRERDGDRYAWFKLIPSLQFQQDLAASFLDFLLRSRQ